jgi:aspartate carbamoyltransferase catalytic subunit
MMVGDLKRGRTVRSLSLLLSLYQNVKIIFSSPIAFKIDDDLRTKLKNKGLMFEETTAFRERLPEVDAIYMTRVQDEYDVSGESAKVDYSQYHLKAEHLSAMKKHAVIMHPLPRRSELDPQIDNDPRAKYWRQERNGMWTRVALMTYVLGIDKHIILPDL